MKLKTLFIGFTLLLFSAAVNATHYRAGEITYRLVSFLTYEVTVTTYTKISGSSLLADRDSIDIDWGDGTFTSAMRVNGPDNRPPGGNGIPDGAEIIPDFQKNEYKATHTYSGPAPFYVISTIDPNRIGGIQNIDQGNSVMVPFYIEDTLRIYPEAVLPANSSPILLNPPIDFANVNDTFYHNPNAWDLEGDSLHFSLIPPKESRNSDVPVYQFPDEVIPGPDNNFNINSATGELIWAVPKKEGIYNVAILIREYRSGLFLGTILRDMQIIVRNVTNDPPQILPVADTCVQGGDNLTIRVDAFDPNNGDTVFLEARGGPFQLTNSPATFTTLFDTVPEEERGLFSWNTLCEHIRNQFYTVVFRAADNFRNGIGNPEPLVDLETWLIEVTPPAPKNFQAVLDTQSLHANLSWDSLYVCADFEDFRYFSIWKKEGCDSIEIGPCDVGIANLGYTLLADSVTNYSFIDEDIVPGHEYSYRVIAHFAQTSQNGSAFNKLVSVPSNQGCVRLPLDLPIITHVSILTTDTISGDVYVEWANPRADSAVVDKLDTILHGPPYFYRIYRSEGFPGENAMQFVNQTPNRDTFYQLVDTFFFDTASNLNTKRFPYSYKMAFFADGDSMGETEMASSPWLAIEASDQSALLNVIAEVPWTNYRYEIYRSRPNSTFIDVDDSTYLVVDTSSSTYQDTGLFNDSMYCYRVKALGRYSLKDIGLKDTLINFSQDSCIFPIDTIPPCPPIFNSATNACDSVPICLDTNSLINTLNWGYENQPCANDIDRVRIYYRAGSVGDYELLDSVFSNISSFLHQLGNDDFGLAGCYFLTAVDGNDNESIPSDTLCVGNCPFYQLPNVFTPNGDFQNDIFRPICSRFIDRVDIKIFNRWGNVVYEGEGLNPSIDWDGTDINNGKIVNDGVYFYSGFYYEITLEGIVQRPLPPNTNGAGFIHVMTK